MANKPKQKGTAGETAVTKWAHKNGFPHAERLALSGIHDRGDVRLTPLGWTAGLIVAEVKNVKTASNGQPSAGQLQTWMAEAEAERANAGAEHCPLIVKRSGTTDVGRWFAYLPLWSLIELLEAPVLPADHHAPVCLTVASLAALLRAAGYGVAVEEGAVA